jgi:hypothetical protein
MGVALAITLATFIAVHLAIALSLARRGAWLKALGALALPPLAAWWAWDRRAKTRPLAVAWLAAIGAYAALVFAAAH